jgi:hypothetical protein
MKLYLPPGASEHSIAGDFFISSVTVQKQGAHDVIRIWSRGAMAGILMLELGEGSLFAQRLGLQPRSCPRCGRPHDGDEHEEGAS